MQAQIVHVGGPTTLIRIGPLRIVTDPTLDPAGGLYPLLPQYHLRKNGDPSLSLAALETVDAVLLSHDQHADNLDAQGRALVDRAPLTITTPEAAQRLGGSAQGGPVWSSTTVEREGVRLDVTQAPARHGPPGSEPLVGTVTGFVLHGEALDRAIWVTGDTVWYEELPAIARQFDVGTIIMHLGAVRAPDGSALTMSSRDIPALHDAFPHAAIHPVHFDAWAHFTETEAALRETPESAVLHWLPRS